MLKEEIQKTMIVKYKEGNKNATDALRFVLSEIKYAEINKKSELNDVEIVTLLQKEIKKRKEAIDMFRKGNREDLVSKENEQLVEIEKFAPQEISDAELSDIIDEETKGVSGVSNMGRAIGLVMARVKGRADGAKVANMARQRLQAKN